MAFPREIRELALQIGKVGVNALYPNEFEYYAITLELTDSQGSTIEYLTFPVNPESMSYDNQTLVNVKKTMSGVSALNNETFHPRRIEMTGTFGRKFKLILDNKAESYESVVANESTLNGHYDAIRGNIVNVKKSIFNPRLKTGYGTLKILEAIIEKSSSLDKYNQSHRLYLYNPSLGHNWLVALTSANFSQDRTSSNMLWKYNIQLTALSPLENVNSISVGNKSLSVSTGISVLQSGLNSLTSKILSST